MLMHEGESLFLILGLILLLLPSRFFLFVFRRRLLLAAQLRILRFALIVIILFLLGLKVLILTLVLIGSVHYLGLFLLLHDHLNSPCLKILNQRIKLSSFNPQKLYHLFFLSEGELDVELLVAGIDAVELDGLDVLNPEIKDGFGDEN